MKLAPQSIPYRAVQKVAGIVVLLFFIVNSNDWGLPAAVGVAGAVLLVAFGYEVAYYRRFDYELTEDTLDISSGVISRREREIPYRRIQNVDVSRSVIQRALGVAAVDLETAGGSSTEGSIRFVAPEEATRIQREVQRRKSAASSAASGTGTERGVGSGARSATTAGADSTGPAEEELFAISSGELALVGALSFDGRLIGLLAFLSSGSVPVLSSVLPSASAVALTATAVVAVGALFLASWVIGAGIAFSNYYGFRLSRAGDELRYERGLFRRYSGSIPTDKIQTLSISDNPAKRALGYASLSIETAGYAPGQGGGQGSQAAVPIASTDRVYRLAHEVESFGAPTFSRPPKRVRWRYAFRYALVIGVLVGLAFAVDWFFAVGLPWYGLFGLLLAVPPAAHLKWKHRGYWLGEDHFLTRNGFWSRTVTVVPYYRIQTVIDTRTVFQRRWGVATIVADTAGTSSLVGADAAAVDFATDEAIELRTTLRDRLRTAVAEHRDSRNAFEWVDSELDTPAPAGDPEREERPTDDLESTGPDTRNTADAAEPDASGDGVVRPDFSGSDRDYSEPADRVDTGEYAVDRFPSDADVANPGSGTPDDGGGDADDADDAGDEADRDGDAGDGTGENGIGENGRDENSDTDDRTET
ncbi:membrane-flanked domain protein [Halorubrum aidingense JCM 13560]|uniref:Membrane-flanked domain protein n=1 Tax=Halorubrum aidingense JCM 13560 TaxID=1230454 RepID=M0PH56_9EURY|nr:PH domain-containing protein [Halorubrum aidingense]EMA68919.1 membrane-flanked domain protein [Halorubrum aidingense JCM 13560]